MKRMVAVLVAGLWAGAAPAGEAESLVARIDSLYHAAPHWRVAFRQTVRYPVFDESETEQGTLAVGPGGRFRLELKNHVVVSDGDTLWTHNVRANQVQVELVAAAGEAVRPADFLFHFRDDYAASVCSRSGPGLCLHLVAGDETAFIRQMWLWVDTLTAHVRSAVYLDINNNETTFEFRKIDFAYRPKPAAFRYEPPPGVEVVRMP